MNIHTGTVAPIRPKRAAPWRGPIVSSGQTALPMWPLLERSHPLCKPVDLLVVTPPQQTRKYDFGRIELAELVLREINDPILKS